MQQMLPYNYHDGIRIWVFIIACLCAHFSVLASSSTPPSLLLSMHRMYRTPPHDLSLYKVLQVNYNATAQQIDSAFRRQTQIQDKAAQLHNDVGKAEKQKIKNHLAKIRHAYEVLREDATRLPYHKYGLVDTKKAVLILTGFRNSNLLPTKEESELLQLMGYQKPSKPTQARPIPEKSKADKTSQLSHRQKQRVWYLAAMILEKIRPLVEGTIEEATLAHAVAQECDRLKTLPLGAQIIRCVGRAYRKAGKRLLRVEESYKCRRPKLIEPVREGLQDAKHLFNAAVASGRVVLREQLLWKETWKKSKEESKSIPKITYQSEGGFGGMIEEEERNLLSDGESVDDFSEEELIIKEGEINEEIKQRANDVITGILQIEAFWKIRKIGLSKTIKEACDLILSGEYFFFPSHPYMISDRRRDGDGWVGDTGEAIDANIGRIRAAMALVLMGDIMVRCSKEGTAWME